MIALGVDWVEGDSILKWALVLILMSGIWDTGLRYDTYEDCMIKGVKASFNNSRLREEEKQFYDLDPDTRNDYQDIVKCVPSK